MLTLAGGLLLLANWPFTLAFIMPVNNKLLDMHADSDPAAISDLLIRWNRLHAVRTLLGAAAMVLLIIAIAS